VEKGRQAKPRNQSDKSMDIKIRNVTVRQGNAVEIEVTAKESTEGKRHGKTTITVKDVNVTTEVSSSGRRTRNVATPNWADIISGRKSFKKDGGVLVQVKKEPVDVEYEKALDQSNGNQSGIKDSPTKSKQVIASESTDVLVKQNKSRKREEIVGKHVNIIKTIKSPQRENSAENAKHSRNIVKNSNNEEDLFEMETSFGSVDGVGLAPQRGIYYKFACTECDKKFCVGYLLEEHMKNIHSKNVDGIATGNDDDEPETEVNDMFEVDGDDDDDYADDVDDEELEDHNITDDDFSPDIKVISREPKSDDIAIPKDTKGRKKPTCNICGQTFLTPANMRRHSLLHTNKMYECPFCAKLMKRKDYVNQHVRKVHKGHNLEENPIDFDKFTHIIEPEVDESGNQDETKSQLEGRGDKPARSKVLAGLGKKVCPDCSKLFDAQEDLEQHMLSVHKKELKDAAYTCQGCKKQFKSLVSYQVHKLSHRKKDFICQHCGKKFANNSQLQVHRRHDHQLQYTTLMYFGYLMNEGKISCEICSQDFESMEEFHKHRLIHLVFDYLCDKCGNGFKVKEEESFQKHKESDCTKVNYHLQCGVCEMQFSMYDTRRKHVLANHPKENDFFCHHCGKTFDDMKDLTEHFRIHKEEKVFICEFCNKRFFEKRNLVDHRDLHRDTKSWKCHICDRLYISSKSLQRHIKLHLSRSGKNCKHCDSKFRSNEELEDHMSTVHADQDNDKYHLCHLCPRTFLDKSQLLKHMQIHDGDNTYTCDICQQIFDANVLPQWRHLKKAHPEEAKKRGKRQYVCQDCPFVTQFKQRLERHMETHRETKDFECEYCHRKYQTTSSLMTHMIVHRGKVKKGAKPEPICTWTNCRKQYVKHSLYKRHLISHIFKVKVGKDLCDCGRCQYSAPQPGQSYFVQDDSDYSAVGFVDADGNPLVATKLANSGEQSHVINVQVLPAGGTEQSYESMDVLQEAIAQIEDIENKNNSNGKKNVNDENKQSIGDKPLGIVACEKKLKMEAENKDKLKTAQGSKPEEVEQRKDVVPSSVSDIVEEKGNLGVLDDESIPTTETESMVEEVIVTGASTDINPVELPSYRFECGVCELMFQYKCLVLFHLEEDHPDHRYPHCPTCGKCIIDKKNLTDHMRIHDEARSFRCNVCNKGFRTKQCLRQHSFIHAITKPFTCNYCGHGFTQKGFYLEHIRRHTGMKPFKCSVCSKAFVSKNLLRIHMFSHANSRPHQCELCPKSFSENYQLTAHIRTHNDERPFKCTECDKAFFVKPKLIRHLNTVHGIDKEELTNYVATRVGEGVGYRDKTKVKNQMAQKTQVVYIDTHGNIVSQELKEEEMIEEQNQPASSRHTLKIRPNAPFIVMKNSGETADTSNLDEHSFEVVTKRDEHGSLHVNAIMQGDLNATETVTEDGHVTYQSTGGNLELNGENYTLVTQAGQDEHIALITQTLDGVEGQNNTVEGDSHIQVITQEEGTENEFVGEENLQVITEEDLTEGVAGAENFSINIGEDGTVDAADFEKIEALRNMYSDQQIVIVLESQQQ
jgi:KRAB domain-containing zinc finger protein